ncbi:MAG: indole-3-glycerol-phosphate synthase [Phycisphaerales bacterium]
MPDFLSHMAELSADREAQARAAAPEHALRRSIRDLPPARALPAAPFLLIAELKNASPSEGDLAGAGPPITERAAAYARGGAGVISVLTEPSRFGGSLDDLREVSAAVPVPTMRKDFLIGPYQVVEARATGASGVLLIVKMLTDDKLLEMLSVAAELAMFGLVECFDRDDLGRCGAILPRPPSNILLGLNTRDLRDLTVRPERLEDLAGAFPGGFPRIAESGMESAADVRRAARLGYGGALVGTALMRAPDPETLCRDMLREARSCVGAPP